MNELQRYLKETELDFLNESYHGTPERIRQHSIMQIDKEIAKLEERKRRLEAGLDDYMLYE